MTYIFSLTFLIMFIYNTILGINNSTVDVVYLFLVFTSYYFILQFMYYEFWNMKKKGKLKQMGSILSSLVFLMYPFIGMYFVIFLVIISVFNADRTGLYHFGGILLDLLPIYFLNILVFFISNPINQE